MDAFGIVYPQYWQDREYNANFDSHLKILKVHYGYSTPFITMQHLKGQLDLVLSLATLDITAKNRHSVPNFKD
jgi:hypothetical protein